MEKELSKLKRRELYEIILEYALENERLHTVVDVLEEELKEKIALSAQINRLEQVTKTLCQVTGFNQSLMHSEIAATNVLVPEEKGGEADGENSRTPNLNVTDQ